MLRCLDCDEVMDYEDLVEVRGDSYECWGETGYSTEHRCGCGCTDFEEVEICDCGRDYISDYETICQNCKEDIAKDFRAFCRDLTEEEKDYLFELLEDEDYVKTI